MGKAADGQASINRRHVEKSLAPEGTSCRVVAVGRRGSLENGIRSRHLWTLEKPRLIQNDVQDCARGFQLV